MRKIRILHRLYSEIPRKSVEKSIADAQELLLKKNREIVTVNHRRGNDHESIPL